MSDSPVDYYCGFWYQVREEPRLTEQQFGERYNNTNMCHTSGMLHMIVERSYILLNYLPRGHPSHLPSER